MAKSGDIRAGGAFIELSADGKGLTRTLNQTQSRVRSFSATITRSLAGIAGVAGFGMLVKSAINAASNVETVTRRFNTLFQGVERQTADWAEGMSKAFGIGEVSMMGYLNSFQQSLTPMGFANDQAAELSKTMTRLSMDMAAALGTAPEQAADDLSRAIMGMNRGLVTYGIRIEETDVKQEALRLGMESATGQLTQQQSAYARMSLILQKASSFMGAASTETGTWAQVTMRLREAWTDLLENVGAPLIAKLTPMIDWFSQMVRSIRDWLGENPAFIAGIFDIGKTVLKIVAAIQGAVAGLLGYVTAKLTTGNDSIYQSIIDIANMISPEFGDAIEDIISKVKDTVPIIENMMGDFFQGVTFLGYEMIDKIGIAVKGMAGIAARDVMVEIANTYSKAAVFVKWIAKAAATPWNLMRSREWKEERNRKMQAELQAAGSGSALAAMFRPSDKERRAAMGEDTESIYTKLRQGAFGKMGGRINEIMDLWMGGDDGGKKKQPGGYGLPKIPIPGAPETPTLPAGGVMGFLGARRISEMFGGSARGIDAQQLDVQRDMLNVLQSIRDSDSGAVYA